MSHITIEHATTHLSELIKNSPTGEEIILIENELPVAKLIPLNLAHPQAKRGYAKGRVLYMASDFDDLPEEFKDYI